MRLIRSWRNRTRQWLLRALWPVVVYVVGTILSPRDILLDWWHEWLRQHIMSRPFLMPTGGYLLNHPVVLLLAPIVLTVIVLLIIAFIVSYRESRREERAPVTGVGKSKELDIQATRLAIEGELVGSYLKEKHFRIVDLVRDDHTIYHRTFEKCYIYGPAILLLNGKQNFFNNVFHGISNEESLFYEIEPGRPAVGTIGLDSCSFAECHFSRVGLAGSRQALDQFRAGFTWKD